jgi:hypothetical protein
MHPYDNGIMAQYEGLPRGVREALADPIVQALLAADRIDPRDVADLSRRMAAVLSRRQAVATRTPRAGFTRPGFSWDAFENDEHDLVWPRLEADG